MIGCNRELKCLKLFFLLELVSYESLSVSGTKINLEAEEENIEINDYEITTMKWILLEIEMATIYSGIIRMALEPFLDKFDLTDENLNYTFIAFIKS